MKRGRLANRRAHSRFRLLLDFAGSPSSRNVPDPYYGGMLGFERVLDLLEEAMGGLLDELERIAALRTNEGVQGG